ncbi:MAG: YqaA family protein [Planctomycetota bacterium]
MTPSSSDRPVEADEAADTATETEEKKGYIRRIYDWTIAWAGSRYAPWALFLLAFAEASFFPIPPDALLVAMAVAVPKKSLRYGIICTAGSVAGGCAGYFIGMFFFDAVAAPMLDFYQAWDSFREISAGFRANGFLYVFGAALTPIPYKVFTISAGLCGVSLPVLIAASVVGRGLRFMGQAALFYVFGPQIRAFIERYFNIITIVVLVLLAATVIAVKFLW